MSGLVAALAGLAVLFAERASRSAARSRIRERAGAIRRPPSRARAGSTVRTLALPLAAAGVAVALAGPVMGLLVGAGVVAGRRMRARRLHRSLADPS